MRTSCKSMASRRIISSFVRLWALTTPGIREQQRGKIRDCRPYPLERGIRRSNDLVTSRGTCDTEKKMCFIFLAVLSSLAACLMYESLCRNTYETSPDPGIGWIWYQLRV